jgi:hypothetical protein
MGGLALLWKREIRACPPIESPGVGNTKAGAAEILLAFCAGAGFSQCPVSRADANSNAEMVHRGAAYSHPRSRWKYWNLVRVFLRTQSQQPVGVSLNERGSAASVSSQVVCARLW